MISRDDRLFCVLNSIDDKIKSNRLVFYLYIYQVSGLDINFKYKLGTLSLKSERFSEYLNYLVSEGYIKIHRGTISLTDYGNEVLSEFVFSLDELEYLEFFKEKLSNLTDEELYFLVVLDTLISEIKEKDGVQGLIRQKEQVKTTLKQLTSIYSDKNFNNALAMLNKLKEGVEK